MNDNLLRQYTGKKNPGHKDVDGEAADDLGAFGWLRGVRDRSIMLEFRRKDGSIKALGYAWLEAADFDPSEGITLKFTGQTVKLVGCNLNGEARPHVRLFDGLVRHRVPWLQEADHPTALETPNGVPLIERIEFSK